MAAVGARVTGLAALYGGSGYHARSLRGPRFGPLIDRLVYLPDAPAASLADHDALIVPSRSHQGLLHATTPRIRQLLRAGGTVAVLGPQPSPWLPGLRWTHRPTNFWWWTEDEPDPPVELAAPDHDLFHELSRSDVTWHVHGVFDPPPGAVTLLETPDGGAVLYIDEVSTPGTLIVTCLDPFYHYGAYFIPQTEDFLAGFLPWVRRQAGLPEVPRSLLGEPATPVQMVQSRGRCEPVGTTVVGLVVMLVSSVGRGGGCPVSGRRVDPPP